MNNSKFWSSGELPKNTNNLKTQSSVKSKLSRMGKPGLIVGVVLVVLALVSYVIFIRPAQAVLVKANAVKATANDVGKNLTDRDLVALDSTLTRLEANLKELKSEKDKQYGWAKNVSLFKAKEFFYDSDRFINSGFYIIDALRETSTVAKPFADAAGLKISAEQEIPQQQGLMEAFQSWVTIMPQVAGQMDGVIEKVAKIGKELEPVNTAKYPESFFGTPIRPSLEFAKNTLTNVGTFGPDIKQALIIFPRLLAVGTPEKRYMIIMQNDKELRPTGGFMTNYATFKIRDGLLQSDFSSKDMYSIDNTLDLIDATYDFPDPPAAYTKYLKVERWYARDMNYSPDFVSSMDQFLKFYNLAGRLDPFEIKPVDGIIGIDTYVIQELLEVTGPVTVSGITYTKDNVVLELERIASLALKEQANRKRVLGNLMEAMLVNVFQSDRNLWPKLIDRGVSLALRKHVQAYVFDAEAQALIDKYNFSGRIILDTPGDYSAVISTNLGGDKTNWFTTKKVTHSLVKEVDKWVRIVKIDYTYNQPAQDYAPFLARFRDWVRVYAPLGSQIISVEGSEGESTSDQELNKTYFTGYIELGPGETKSLTFKYYLPAGKVDNSDYSITIQKQAGIDTETHVITAGGKTQEVKLDKDTKVNFKLK